MQVPKAFYPRNPGVFPYAPRQPGDANTTAMAVCVRDKNLPPSFSLSPPWR